MTDDAKPCPCCRRRSLQGDVREFNKAIGVPMRTTPGWCSSEELDLAWRLMIEEYGELVEASDDGDRDLPATADAIVDLLYVTIGLACRLGIDLAPLWCAVHQKNLEKVNGPVREDGKRLKPAGWTPPDIAGLLRAQGWGGE